MYFFGLSSKRAHHRLFWCYLVWINIIQRNFSEISISGKLLTKNQLDTRISPLWAWFLLDFLASKALCCFCRYLPYKSHFLQRHNHKTYEIILKVSVFQDLDRRFEWTQITSLRNARAHKCTAKIGRDGSSTKSLSPPGKPRKPGKVQRCGRLRVMNNQTTDPNIFGIADRTNEFTGRHSKAFFRQFRCSISSGKPIKFLVIYTNKGNQNILIQNKSRKLMAYFLRYYEKFINAWLFSMFL